MYPYDDWFYITHWRCSRVRTPLHHFSFSILHLLECMARSREKDNSQVGRIIVLCALWALWLFVALSCVSYHEFDPPTPRAYFTTRPDAQNWCGLVGAYVAWFAMSKIGPGVFVAIVLLGYGLFAWTRRQAIQQWPLRVIGGALLICCVSAMFNMFGGGARSETFADGRGGVVGIALGTFLRAKFSYLGSWLILLPSLLVGLLLVADEFMLALPARLAFLWSRMPRKQMASATGGVMDSISSSLRGIVDSFSSERPMGKKPRKEKDKIPEPEEPRNATVSKLLANKEEKEESSPKKEKESASATAVAEPPKGKENDEQEDHSPPIAEPIVRKPVAPKTTPVFTPKQQPQSPKQDLGNYKLPGLDLLDEPEPINMTDHDARVREKAQVLNAALESFNIQGRVAAIDTGPVVTMFEVDLAPGVKSSQVGALSKDIARALKSPPIRTIDNIPGKSTMGIEVPNLNRERVRLKELFQLGGEQIGRMALPMCLGKDASGNALIEDLARIPHMLIAGTTGSGKSVCINSIIMTLVLTKMPDEVKLIMVDPKMVEMQDYKAIPHLMAPIIDDMSKAESILEWACGKMDERYEIMAEAGVRNIKDYNKLSREEIATRFNATTEEDKAKLVYKMPYIVIIIDELADLMMTSKEVEGHIVRIAQKARAVGIHLILATQRPEAQVVTGLIKSNMPGRVCFQVRSRLDSRIMLDQSGGELLLGQGDMMMLRPTGGGLIRAQGAFVDDKEIRNVCKFLKDIAQPEFHPELMQLGTSAGLQEGEERDPLYNDAVDIMVETGRGSVSLIQRRLNIGYSRASRIIDQMRRLGIVGAYKGSQASEVMITKDEWEAMKAADTTKNIPSGDGTPGSTGGRNGMGATAGFAQQVGSNFAEDDDDDSVPDEMPGEHRY